MNELADARAAARRAIERLHLTPVMFELGARPYPPRDLYLAYLRQSDVFVGIYGESYGWIAPGGRVSGLEDEYLAASEKPKLVYVQSPAPRREPRLAEMLQRVGGSGLSYRTFSHAKELVGLIGSDLALLLSERFGAATEPPKPATEPPRPATELPGAPTDPSTAPAEPGDTADPVRDGRSQLGEANRFIGRHRELAAVRELLADPQHRLVTLVGPGGIGKTRLALETVAAVASEYETVATADLDQVSSVPLVPPAIAAALRVQEATGPVLLDSVVGYVGSRRILLVLDSFEQVIGAASVVARLVAGTTRLTVLVTSREPLHLTGERVFEVPPLDVPTWSDGIDAARRSDSVQLFVDRAVAGGAHLRLDSAEVHTIADICHRLDGLPLAIELAASRARMLDLDDLLRRLDASLVTLTGGARDLPTRQRTLNSAIAWSYDLLDDPDRRLLGRLGVFEGSFALDAAEAICGDDGVPSVFDGISSLVDKALLRPDHARPGQPRFAMLQVVREYATQRLSATGEADRLRERHAEFYRRLTAEAGARLKHGGMRSVVEQYIADQGNGRAAVQWFLDTGDGDSAARMGLSIWPMLFTQGLLTEGHEAMERALETGLTLTEDNRANARLVLGLMAFGRGDYDRAGAVLQPAYERYVQRGDESGAATASVPLGVIAAVRTPGEGEGLLHGAVDGFRRLDDRWGLTFALLALGTTLATGNREGDAIAPLEEGAQVARQIQDDVLLSNALIGLGWARLRLGEVAAAGEQLDEALDLSVTFGSRETIARALDAVAALAEKTGDASRGATLFGAAEGVRGALRADVWEIDRASHAETAQRLRARLGDEPYQRLSGRGASLALDEVLHLASAR